ncbi:MAG: O-antigen ligase family protein [Bacteroidota bacterium]
MTIPTPNFRRILQWSLLATIVCVESVIWINASDSSIAKTPTFFLGAMFCFAIIVSEILFSLRIEYRRSLLWLLVFLHLPLFMVSAWWTFDPVSTWHALIFSTSCLIFFCVGSTAFRTPAEIRMLFDGLEWLTALLCVIAVAQSFFADLLPLRFFLGPERRIPSLLGNSIAFSAYIIVTFPLILSRVFAHRLRGLGSFFRIVLLTCMVLLLVLTQTRSSILAFIASLAVYAMFTLRLEKTRLLVLGGTILLFGMALYGTIVQPEIGKRFSHMFDESSTSSFARRVSFWEAGGNAFFASPLFGHGIGSFERTVFQYRSPDYWKVASEDIVPHAHDELLEIAVEYGAVGLALSLTVLFLVLRQARQIARHGREWEQWMSIGIVGAIVAVAVDNLANTSLREAPIALLVWLLMGLLCSEGLGGGKMDVMLLRLKLPRSVAVTPLLLWIGLALEYGSSQLNAMHANVHLEQALIADPRHTSAVLSHLQAAVEEDPTDLVYLSRLAQEYLDQHRWENALQSIRQLHVLSPRYPQSSLMKAYALLRIQRYPEALESISREIRERNHPLAYLILGEAYRGLGNLRGEREALLQLLREDLGGNFPVPYQAACKRLVQVTKVEGDTRENEALFDSLEQRIPNDAGFFASLKSRRKNEADGLPDQAPPLLIER